jgi:DNA-binding IclR family transcriptional regulator
LLPEALDNPFTTSDLARALGQPRWLMQKMTYCLREMGVIEQAGKQGNAILYQKINK